MRKISETDESRIHSRDIKKSMQSDFRNWRFRKNRILQEMHEEENLTREKFRR
nr:MAG TPA: hypothetical protein [Caudoviricetes sp.]